MSSALGTGKLIAGRFQLDREIARGGMGAVWAAHARQLDVPVAVKFMDRSLIESDEARTRFEREARASAQLRSPHVVQVLAHGIDDDRPYIVMELLEGEDLGQLLKREQTGPLGTASLIAAQIAKALRRAQELGVIHRDLKPSNIFLTRVGDELFVKLLDFGIAKMTRLEVAPSTSAGMFLGSPLYMSPEQLRGQPIDHRADLWSLGVVLFRAVTGKPAFAASALPDLTLKICVEPLPRASALGSKLPIALDAFFERALARNREERFSTATEMAAAFDAIAKGGSPRSSYPAPVLTGGPAGAVAPPVVFAPVMRSPGYEPPHNRSIAYFVLALAMVIVIIIGAFALRRAQNDVNNAIDEIGGAQKRPR